MEISKQVTATKELDKNKEFLFSLNAHPVSIFTFGAAELCHKPKVNADRRAHYGRNDTLMSCTIIIFLHYVVMT